MALAARKGLGALAVTDHDTLAGLGESELAAAAYGVKFVPGIELSAMYNETEIHLLGLFIDWREEALANAVERWYAERCARNVEMLARLNAAGVHINMDHLTDLMPAGNNNGLYAITRMHFARAIADAGYCPTPQKAFAEYLMPGTPTYVERRGASAEEAISVIRGAGGISVLAHPLRYGVNARQLEHMIKELAFDGLCGLECYYSGHDLYEQQQMIRLAKKYRLCVSGGSDFHGGFDASEPGTGYGGLFVPMSVYDSLKSFQQRLALADNEA